MDDYKLYVTYQEMYIQKTGGGKLKTLTLAKGLIAKELQRQQPSCIATVGKKSFEALRREFTSPDNELIDPKDIDYIK